jgi:hypothetical protein
LSDAPSSSYLPRNEGNVAAKTDERDAHMMAFDNLDDDSSLDVCETPSPKGTGGNVLHPHCWCLVCLCIVASYCCNGF